MTTPQSMAAGAIAGAAVVLATNPIWTINVSNKTLLDTIYLDIIHFDRFITSFIIILDSLDCQKGRP